MKRAQRCDALRNDWVHRGTTAHVEERSLARKASPYLSELNRRNVRRDGNTVPMTQGEPESCSDCG
jgi:hypothetical protein